MLQAQLGHQPHRRSRSGRHRARRSRRAAANRDVVFVGYGGGGVGLKAVGVRSLVRDRDAAPGDGRGASGCSASSLRSGTTGTCGGVDVLEGLPNGGVVTRANVSKFKAEWPG